MKYHSDTNVMVKFEDAFKRAFHGTSIAFAGRLTSAAASFGFDAEAMEARLRRAQEGNVTVFLKTNRGGLTNHTYSIHSLDSQDRAAPPT